MWHLWFIKHVSYSGWIWPTLRWRLVGAWYHGATLSPRSIKKQRAMSSTVYTETHHRRCKPTSAASAMYDALETRDKPQTSKGRQWVRHDPNQEDVFESRRLAAGLQLLYVSRYRCLCSSVRPEGPEKTTPAPHVLQPSALCANVLYETTSSVPLILRFYRCCVYITKAPNDRNLHFLLHNNPALDEFV